MSIQWGAWSQPGSDNNKMRVGLDVTWSSVTGNSTSVTATVKAYIQDYYNYAYDPEVLNWGGALTAASASFHNTGGSSSGPNYVSYYVGQTTWTHTFTGSGTSDGQVFFSAEITGVYNGTVPYVGLDYQIPARPYISPYDPVGLTAAYALAQGPTVVVKWSVNADAQHPVTSFQISRAGWYNSRNAMGPSEVIATVTGGNNGQAKSWTDTSVSNNTVYTYSVTAVNNAGSSGSPSVSGVNTPPAAPTNVQAAMQPSGSAIQVSWGTGGAYTYGKGVTYTVTRSVGGGSYISVATGLTGSPWTDTTPGAGTNEYQVTAIASTANGFETATQSAAVSSNTVSTIVPPLAPTGLSTGTGAVADFTQAVTLSWNYHDGGDGAAQSHYTVICDEGNGGAQSTWTTVASDIPSTVSQWVIPAATFTNGKTYQFAVSTEAVVSAGFGPASTAFSVVASTTPVVTITNPTSTPSTTGHIDVTWTYTQAESSAQASATVTLLQADGAGQDTDETDQVTGAGTSQALSTYCVGGQNYTVQVQVTSAAGLTGTASQAFTVNVPPPAPISTIAQYQPETGTMLLNLQATTPSSTQATVISGTVERSVDDGQTWVTLASSRSLPYDIIDPLPTIGGQNTYRITGASSEPAYAINDLVNVVTPAGVDDPADSVDINAAYDDPDRKWLFLNYGPAFSQILRTRTALQITAGGIPTVTLTPLLGWADPLAQTGIQQTIAVMVTAGLAYAMPGEADAATYAFDSPPADWLAMCGSGAPIVCLRTPAGHRVFGVVTSSMGMIASAGTGAVNLTYTRHGRAEIQFAVTQAQYTESYA